MGARVALIASDVENSVEKVRSIEVVLVVDEKAMEESAAELTPSLEEIPVRVGSMDEASSAEVVI